MYAKIPDGFIEIYDVNDDKVLYSSEYIEGYKRLELLNKKPTDIDENSIIVRHIVLLENDTLTKEYIVWNKDDDIPSDVINAPQSEIKKYENAVQEYIDKCVQKKGYDNVYTCLSYKDDPDPIFRQEAHQVLCWRSVVWRTAQNILNDWTAGKIEKPTIEDVLKQFPDLGW